MGNTEGNIVNTLKRICSRFAVGQYELRYHYMKGWGKKECSLPTLKSVGRSPPALPFPSPIMFVSPISKYHRASRSLSAGP